VSSRERSLASIVEGDERECARCGELLLTGDADFCSRCDAAESVREAHRGALAKLLARKGRSPEAIDAALAKTRKGRAA
jgi:hypothetical protein